MWSVALLVLSAGLSSDAARADSLHPNRSCQIAFARTFYASVGTTVTLPGQPPATQSGRLYINQDADLSRWDQFYRGRQATFIVDSRKLRAYFFEDNPSSDAVDSTTCSVFFLKRRLLPLCVLSSYQQDTTLHPIRGVPVTRFHGVERYNDLPMVEQSFFVFNRSTYTDVLGTAGAGAAGAEENFIPWRIQTEARTDLEYARVAAAPSTLPNWRLFGQPMFDELALPFDWSTGVQPWTSASTILTIDFYDYYPMPLSDALFEVPASCLHAPSGDSQDAPYTASFDGDASVLELMAAHRYLVEWILLQNASTS